jgi:hypothetical protein
MAENNSARAGGAEKPAEKETAAEKEKPAARTTSGAKKGKRIVPTVTLESRDDKGKRVQHKAGEPVMWPDAEEAADLIKKGQAAEYTAPKVKGEE